MAVRKHRQLEREMWRLKNPRQEREPVVPNPKAKLLKPGAQLSKLVHPVR